MEQGDFTMLTQKKRGNELVKNIFTPITIAKFAIMLKKKYPLVKVVKHILLVALVIVLIVVCQVFLVNEKERVVAMIAEEKGIEKLKNTEKVVNNDKNEKIVRIVIKSVINVKN